MLFEFSLKMMDPEMDLDDALKLISTATFHLTACDAQLHELGDGNDRMKFLQNRKWRHGDDPSGFHLLISPQSYPHLQLSHMHTNELHYCAMHSTQSC